MSVKTKTVMKSDKNTTFASASNITAAEHRAFLEDLIDSYEDFIGSYTTAQIAGIASPTLRQIVFDTDLDEYYFYNGTSWIPFSSMFKVGSAANSLLDKRSTTGSGANGTTIGYQAINSIQNGQAIGEDANNAGRFGQAIGYNSENTVQNGQAIGSNTENTGLTGQAIGSSATNSGTSGQAIGNNATNRINTSTNIAGAIVVRKSETGTVDDNPYWLMSGAEVIILTKEVDLKSAATITITIPSNVKIFINEVGTIMTSANTVTGQASVSFGKTGSNAFLLAATATTGLTAAGKRDKQTSILQAEGVTSLVADITAGATGTTALGRFYFKGFVVEDE